MSALGIKMCERCCCHEGVYEFVYDDPLSNKRVVLKQCRTCQIQMINWLENAQGMNRFERGN